MLEKFNGHDHIIHGFIIWPNVGWLVTRFGTFSIMFTLQKMIRWKHEIGNARLIQQNYVR